jgi:hypothetical protein
MYEHGNPVLFSMPKIGRPSQHQGGTVPVSRE